MNMTLWFSQEQAAAVYAATRSAKKGDVFVSPFIGRLDDMGEKGLAMPKEQYVYDPGKLTAIPYRELDLSRTWQKQIFPMI